MECEGSTGQLAKTDLCHFPLVDIHGHISPLPKMKSKIDSRHLLVAAESFREQTSPAGHLALPTSPFSNFWNFWWQVECVLLKSLKHRTTLCVLPYSLLFGCPCGLAEITPTHNAILHTSPKEIFLVSFHFHMAHVQLSPRKQSGKFVTEEKEVVGTPDLLHPLSCVTVRTRYFSIN